MVGPATLNRVREGSSPSSPATRSQPGGVDAGTPANSCPLCERDVPKGHLERHHLRTRRTDKAAVEWICRDCHKTIHGLFSNTDLRDSRNGLDTLEGLLGNAQVQAALVFIRKVPAGSYMKMRESRGRKRR